MTVLERFKAPTKSAAAKATDVNSRATDAAAKTRDKAADAAKSALSDDAKRELSEALELILTKVRESATLAKLQDEAHRQLSDALETAREKVIEATPVAKAKLQDARHVAEQHMPQKQKRRSKLRMIMMVFMAVPAAICAIVALKKKMASRRDDMDDYDAGGELAWGESSFNQASANPRANAGVGNAPSEPAVVASSPASNGSGAGGPSLANGMASSSESKSSSTPDAPASELLNE